MEPIYVGIYPQNGTTRILALSTMGNALLKARLCLHPSHRRALSSLLEAIALWQGRVVRAALVVDVPEAPCESSLYRDMFPDFGDGTHYSLEYVQARRAPRRDGIEGMGRFHDLRQLITPSATR